MAFCMACRCEVPLYAMANGTNGEATVCENCSQSLAGSLARRSTPIRQAIAQRQARAEKKGKR